ncbi:peroxidase-like [Trichogramma pretiosum]|uniref:peroxidase-like n=1 Tax=Trichogramma pretiosum TaxID=7493 RepID=UPI0006C9A895|nr:peroxidase-like [Trichogramma pretiosum]
MSLYRSIVALSLLLLLSHRGRLEPLPLGDSSLPSQRDLDDAADFGIQAMNDLYSTTEPKLYEMGLFLKADEPARYLAAFNEQSDDARQLAKLGYASIEAAKRIRSKFPNVVRLKQASGAASSQLPDCPRRGIVPQCPPASLRYRTTDGSCNNLRELWWGSAMSTMQRFLPAAYEDGIESVRRSVTGAELPSARRLSDQLHEERDEPLSSVSHMLMQWGQFVDHDITATGQSRGFRGSVPQCCRQGGAAFQPRDSMHPDCLPIAVEADDSHLGRFGIRCLEFVRSGPAPREDCGFGPREQLSQVTSFIDASTVYSSSAKQSDALRLFRNGLMQYGKQAAERPLLPKRRDLESDLCRRGSLSTSCFQAGDARLSEQPALIGLHVVFLRLHNRLATRLSSLNPHWSDERLFQETRRIVGALVQHITYREFLPIVLGPDVMGIFDIELRRKGYYDGYDPSVNPNIANSFAAAAYRFGHSLVQRTFARFDSQHQPLLDNVTIHEEFAHPSNLEAAGAVDRIILGLVNQPAQRRDRFISRELTRHLFQSGASGFGLDLAAINIQRGRDHGIPSYASWREACSLGPIRDWNDVAKVSSVEAAAKFQRLYASALDLDLFSAGLAERPVAGGLVGPTFACIIAQQFRALRKGDRFWYENDQPQSGFSPEQLKQIRRSSLAQLLCATAERVESIQPFVMLMADSLRNKRLSCRQEALLQPMDLEPWRESSPRASRRTGAAPAHHQAQQQQQQQQRPVKQPTRTRISQNNRVQVARPVGSRDNLTIVVHNTAVNAPIFVSDSVYGSDVRLGQFLPPASAAPTQALPSTPVNQSPANPPRPPTYYPHNFNDPNNPDPPLYGYESLPQLIRSHLLAAQRQHNQFATLQSPVESAASVTSSSGTDVHELDYTDQNPNDDPAFRIANDRSPPLGQQNEDSTTQTQSDDADIWNRLPKPLKLR